jgi:hypothetical protein
MTSTLNKDNIYVIGGYKRCGIYITAEEILCLLVDPRSAVCGPLIYALLEP